MNAFDRSRGSPVTNSSLFDRIHRDLSLAHDHAEELHLGGIKEALGEFQGETMFMETKEYMSGAFMVEG